MTIWIFIANTSTLLGV